MANPSLLQQFCSIGQKDAISTILQTAGWSPENPYVNGYQMNTLFNEIFTYLNYLKNKGFSFWEDTKTYKATAGDIDIVRYANKIYFAKLDSNLDGLTPKTPDTNPTYWGVLYDLDKPLDTTYALLGGLATQTFKVADAVNADEAIAFGQFTGYVLPFATSTVPTGFLECNGAELSRTTYANLYAIIGDTYGTGDGSTTFNIPDLRGEFIRGFDNGRGVDSGRGIGTSQEPSLATSYLGDDSGNNATNIDLMEFSVADTLNHFDNAVTITTSAVTAVASSNTNVVVQSRALRPRNIAMMYCIKY